MSRDRISDEPAQDPEELRPVSQPGGTEIAVSTGAHDEDELPLDWPAALPVLPLKNTVLFPHILSPLLVNTKRSQALIDEVLVRPDRMMVAAAAATTPTSARPAPWRTPVKMNGKV